MWVDVKIIRFVPSYMEGPGNMRIQMGGTGVEVKWPKILEYYEKVLGWDLRRVYACRPEFEGTTMVLDLGKNGMITTMKPGEFGR